MEGTAGGKISIPHQLLPATNQPSQGACQGAREQPPMTARSPRQNSPLPPPKFRKKDGQFTFPSAAEICVVLKNREQCPTVTPATREVSPPPTASVSKLDLKPTRNEGDGLSHTRQPRSCAQERSPRGQRWRFAPSPGGHDQGPASLYFTREKFRQERLRVPPEIFIHFRGQCVQDGFIKIANVFLGGL